MRRDRPPQPARSAGQGGVAGAAASSSRATGVGGCCAADSARRPRPSSFGDVYGSYLGRVLPGVSGGSRICLAADNKLGGDRQQILTLRSRRAATRLALGQAAKADRVRQILDAELRVLGDDHPSTLTTRHEIAAVLADHGRIGDAEAEFRQVLDAKQRVLGDDHPGTLTTRHEVARVLAAQGRTADAEAEYQQVLDARRRVLGPDHPDTLATRHQIARLLAAQDRTSDAEAEYRQILDAKQRVLGPDHPSTLTTRHNLARVLTAQGGRGRQSRIPAGPRRAAASPRPRPPQHHGYTARDRRGVDRPGTDRICRHPVREIPDAKQRNTDRDPPT